MPTIPLFFDERSQQVKNVKNGVRYKSVTKWFKKDYDIDPILNICRAAKVQISGKNFEPDWGSRH
jgi:hypothetical protein